MSYTKISDNPLVVVLDANPVDLVVGYRRASQAAGAGPLHLFVRPSWLVERGIHFLHAVKADISANRPSTTFTVMAACKYEVDVLTRHGFDNVLANHNAFLDETRIPLAGGPRLFDAAYIGRFVRWKRTELAEKVKRLAVVSGAFELDFEYAAEILASPHVVFTNVNAAKREVRVLPHAAVYDVITSAWCTLALSAEEGAMYASGESLLAGVPLVSTPSRGGRDEFYDDRYVAVVPAESTSVAQAVDLFIKSPPDPAMIREETLKKMMVHRRNFIDHLYRVSHHDFAPFTDERLFLPTMPHHLKTMIQI